MVRNVVSASSEENDLAHVDKATIPERVLAALQQAILTGRLKPGERLVESQLAAKLGVSRGPVRAALRELAYQGLVNISRYKGASVQAMTLTDVEEVYTLRACLESFAVELVIERATEEDIQELERSVADICETIKLHDLPRVVELDLEFHSRLVLAAHNRHLEILMQTIHPQIKMFMIATKMAFATHQDLQEIAREHGQLVRSIRERDVAGATDAISKHIRQSGERLLAAIKAFSDAASPLFGVLPEE
jgi:DNA-binding GntR family transcriptional regulator